MNVDKRLKHREACRRHYELHKEELRRKAREAYHKKKNSWIYKNPPQEKINLFHKEMKKIIFNPNSKFLTWPV